MLDTYWADKQAALRAHMRTEPLATFLEWSTVTATMFVGPAPFVDDECAEMAAVDARRWRVGEEWAGYPNSNLVHQAYHLFQWERHTGRRVDELSRIVEIGGGYGAMARLCRERGFAGTYVLYDLPELSALQRYYLHVTGVAAEHRSALTADECDLLIGLYSLSEMSLETQGRYLARIDGRHFLIGINNAPWQGVDTHAPLDAHFANGQRVTHPHLDGRYYLIG